jgi:hypothetical protein
MLYIPVGNGPVRREYVSLGCGMIVCRPSFRFPKLDCPWIFDNGAFVDFIKGREFDGPQFEDCIRRIMLKQPCQRPLWCVTPDIVANPKSLGFSVGWRKRLPNELRWFLAIQDGMTPVHVENALATAKFDGLFVGGSTDWKNQNAAEWCLFGRGHKLPVHIGRVNGWKRLQWAVNIGADSVDGTGWTRAPGWVDFIRHMPKPERMLWSEFSDDQGNNGVAERRQADAG